MIISKRTTMLESQVQSRIRDKLIGAGWLVNKLIQTSNNGTPDLIAHRKGRTVYIEVKRPGEQPGPLQEYRIGQLRAQGIEAYTIDDPDKLWTYLNPPVTTSNKALTR